MKRLSVAFFAVGLLFSGNVAMAEVPVTATVVNCELTVQASNGPVNALVDLTVMKAEGQKFGDDMRFTEKIRTTASGTASATVRLQQLFPGRDINGLWGVSVDIGVTTVRLSGCTTPVLPSTSTSAPTPDLVWSVLIITGIGVMFAATMERRRRAKTPRVRIR